MGRRLGKTPFPGCADPPTRSDEGTKPASRDRSLAGWTLGQEDLGQKDGITISRLSQSIAPERGIPNPPYFSAIHGREIFLSPIFLSKASGRAALAPLAARSDHGSNAKKGRGAGKRSSHPLTLWVNGSISIPSAFCALRVPVRPCVQRARPSPRYGRFVWPAFCPRSR